MKLPPNSENAESDGATLADASDRFHGVVAQGQLEREPQAGTLPDERVGLLPAARSSAFIKIPGSDDVALSA
jgi:hypothetical protein